MKRKENKDKRITLRISENEYMKIYKKALNSGLSVSEYFRMAALRSEKGKIKTNIIICPRCKKICSINYCNDCKIFINNE